MPRGIQTCQQAYSKCRSIYDKSNWLIRYSYAYLWPINSKVSKRTSQLKSADFDNYAPCSCLGRQAGTELVLEWQRERNRRDSRAAPSGQTSGQRRARPSLLATVMRTHAHELAMMLLLVLLADCICEPISFELSIRLIELIGQFPGGRFATIASNGTHSMSLPASPSAASSGAQVDLKGLTSSLLVNAILFGVFVGATQILTHPFCWLTGRLALKLRVSLSEMIYRKTLTIDRSCSTAASGIKYKQAISLISRDVEYLEGHLGQLPWALTAPVQTIVYTLLLMQRLDLGTALMALAISGVVSLHRSYTNARKVKFARQALRQADKRVSLISETLEAIRIIRMYAWTRPFEAKIEQTRRDEMEQRKVLIRTGCLDAAIFFISCSGAAIATLVWAHYVRALPLTQGLVSQVFTVCALYRRSMSRYIPQGIISWAQTIVVLNRCSAYLCAADNDYRQHEQLLKHAREQDSSSASPASIIDVLGGTLKAPLVNGKTEGSDGTNGAGASSVTRFGQSSFSAAEAAASATASAAAIGNQAEPIVDLKQVSFEWPDETLPDETPKNLKDRKSGKTGSAPSAGKRASPCLESVNMAIGQGELVLVAGNIGSGKSTLLQLILGELRPTRGSISFCSPEALLNRPRSRQQQADRRPASIAYAPQKAWIFSGTVRDNILLGESFSLTRYYEVLRVCSLLVDLAGFSDFDRTQIGERGVTLSEGQKARISLARALYQQADLYLLDDPLSAVDSHVGRHIFNQALVGFLGNKSVLLATHQVQYLPRADRVLYLLQPARGGTECTVSGKVSEGPCQGAGSTSHFGTYAELDKLGVFDELKLSTGVATSSSSATDLDLMDNIDESEVGSGSSELAVDKDYAIGRILSNRLDESGQAGTGPVKLDVTSQRDELRELLETSGNRRARDASTVVKAFAFFMASAGSWLDWLAFVLCSIACRMLFISFNLWLNYWASFQPDVTETAAAVAAAAADSTDSATVNTGSGSFAASLNTAQAIYVSLAMWLVLILVATLRSIRFYGLMMNAAIAVHRKLISSLLCTNLAFFDRTPHGHVLNRVSSDVSHMDTTFRELVEDLSLSGLSLFFIFITIVASSPPMAVVILLVFVASLLLFRNVIDLIGSIKHLEGFRRSSVYSHVATTLDGLPIIRAANKRDMFWDKFIVLLDKSSSVRFLSLSLNRCIIGTLNWLVVLFYLVLIIIDVRDTLSGYGMYAFVGLNLIIQMSRLSQLTFIRFVEFYMSSQAIDRIRKYSNLANEQNELMLQYYQSASNDLEDLVKIQRAQSSRAAAPARAAKSTSSSVFALNEANFGRGSVEFVGVSLKYLNTNKVVLDNLSLTIGPGEKVGIIGRTGAGKSSLITVLFHLYHFEGFVYIDGQDTKELSLDSLRSSISIIPQEPTLFSGTLRYNLDPLQQHQDADLWRALKVVQLDKHISVISTTTPVSSDEEQHDSGRCSPIKPAEASLPSSLLDIMVGESGNNFSTGQRQLICLARAILRRNRLLVLDEATANVDQQTDLLVQQALRSEFKHCTVLTIAHRLNTIVDSDRIMVMDKGRVCEFGKPSELLKRPDGPLAKLIESTGRQQAASLRAKIMQAAKEGEDSG